MLAFAPPPTSLVLSTPGPRPFGRPLPHGRSRSALVFSQHRGGLLQRQGCAHIAARYRQGFTALPLNLPAWQARPEHSSGTQRNTHKVELTSGYSSRVRSHPLRRRSAQARIKTPQVAGCASCHCRASAPMTRHGAGPRHGACPARRSNTLGLPTNSGISRRISPCRRLAHSPGHRPRCGNGSESPLSTSARPGRQNARRPLPARPATLFTCSSSSRRNHLRRQAAACLDTRGASWCTLSTTLDDTVPGPMRSASPAHEAPEGAPPAGSTCAPPPGPPEGAPFVGKHAHTPGPGPLQRTDGLPTRFAGPRAPESAPGPAPPAARPLQLLDLPEELRSLARRTACPDPGVPRRRRPGDLLGIRQHRWHGPPRTEGASCSETTCSTGS